jgi:hypothetical protein
LRRCELNTPNRKLEFNTPTDLRPDELLEVENVILTGGEVDGSHVRSRLQAAQLIARLYESNTLAAVAVVKRPAASYLRKIRERSGYSALSGDFCELGYISVLPGHQDKGLGKTITAETVRQIALRQPQLKLFATTRKDLVRHLLCLNGFRKQGREWPSGRNPGSNLDLWILTPAGLKRKP